MKFSKMLTVLFLLTSLFANGHEDVFGVGVNTNGDLNLSYHSIAEMKLSPEPWGWYMVASIGYDNVYVDSVDQVVRYDSVTETTITTTEGSTTVVDIDSPGNSNFGHCRTNASGKCNQEEVIVIDGTTTTTTNTYDVITTEDIETVSKDKEYEIIANAGVNYQLTKTLYPFIGLGVAVERLESTKYRPNVNLGILYFKRDFGAEIGYNSSSDSINLNFNVRF